MGIELTSHKKVTSQYEKILKGLKGPIDIASQYNGIMKNIPQADSSMDIAHSFSKTAQNALSPSLVTKPQDPVLKISHEEDCEMLDICNSIGATYSMCYKGAIIGCRCSSHDKQMILQQKHLLDFQKKASENQAQNDKRSFWLSIISGAIAGLLVNGVIYLIEYLI